MRVLGGRSLSRGSQRLLRFTWELDCDEMTGRVEVVVTRLIRDADETLLGATSIRQLLVELWQIQILASLVSDAEQEPHC